MCHRTINQHVELAYLDPGINNHYLAQKKIHIVSKLLPWSY